MKKRWMKTMLGLALAVVMLAGSANVAFAAQTGGNNNVPAVRISQAEAESASEVLTLNQPKAGVLETADKKKWYKFEITQRGYFKVNFGIGASTDFDNIDRGWSMKIYKKGDLLNPLKAYSGITTNFICPALPMDKGTYYIEVYATNSYSDDFAPTGCTYNVSVNYTVSNYWEVEDNDTNVVANTIAVNTSYAGNLYHAADVDWYKTTVSDNGYLRLSFTVGGDSNIADIDKGWNVHIYNSAYEQIKSYTGITSSMIAPVLPFSKGTYYIKVCAYNSYDDNWAPTDCTYNLRLASTTSSAWETEKNDTNVTADTIVPDKEYRGLLYQAKDVDWYKVTTTVTGYFRIQFTVDSSVNRDDIDKGWNVSVYDNNLNEIKTYSGITSSETEQILPYAKGTYYIKVCANNNYSDDYAPTDCIYRLKVAQKASSAWESEGNNSRQKADAISLNKAYHGVLTDNKDEDWYKITVKDAGKIKLAFNKDDSVNMEDIHKGWNAYIYNSSSATPIYTLKNVKNADSLQAVLKKGTYYIKVCAADNYSDSYAPTQCPYLFKVSYSQTPAKVTLKSASAGKQQVTLTWAKSKNATGYYIYRSTSKNGSYTKIATIKKAATVKYTDKKSLKSKKTYYYKVVAYHTTDGVTATASASAVKYAKVK